MIDIRPFSMDDYEQWLVLWRANNDGVVKPDVTKETWRRLLDESIPVHGLGAYSGHNLLGLVHYILHFTTGAREPACYMQDVFISEAHRRQGYAKMLVEAVIKEGKRERWNRLYWLAEENNESAQALYKDIGLKLPFSFHVYPISMLD